MLNSALKTNLIDKLADDNQKNLYKKFPSTHYLSKPQNVHNTLLWSTFFRRNLHRLAIDYLGINLYDYQENMLYEMGNSQFVTVIGSRAIAKSFMIALYACCRCIIRPGTIVVIAAGTLGQSRKIVTEKIKRELMGMSKMLCLEIDDIKTNPNDSSVTFRNNSIINVIPANENARSGRSNVSIRDEFRQIKESVDDSVITPFQVIRQTPYMKLEPYKHMPELNEEPVDIYISSSWYDDGSYIWKIVDQAKDEMLKGMESRIMAFDESVTIKHNIKSKKQLLREKKKLDPLSWRIEYLNERLKQNASAFFSYEMLTKNQNLRQPFYPRTIEDYKNRKKNPFSISKQPGEIRIVSCDFAFVDKSGNDNSCFACIRALPESVTHYDDENNSKAIVQQGYRRMVPYLEAQPGGDITKQAIRIRQLFEDFEADYLIVDLRNGGIGILHLLVKTLYDDQRNKEYEPFGIMNNDELAKSFKIPGTKPIIYTISATQKLNSDIALDFRLQLIDNNINLLLNYSQAKEELFMDIKGYKDFNNAEEQVLIEMPFIQTQLLLHETSNLLYEKNKQTGAITVYEQGNNTKDRYTSVSMGSYFISELEKDLFNKSQKQQASPDVFTIKAPTRKRTRI